MVDNGKRVLNSYGKPIATHTLYESGDNFGWIEIEKITKDIYDISLDSIAKQEKTYYMELEKKQRYIIETIEKQRAEQKALALAKEEKLKKEAQARAKKEMEEKARLASITPVQRLIDSYNNIALLINDMRNGKIEDLILSKRNWHKKLRRYFKKILKLGIRLKRRLWIERLY